MHIKSQLKRTAHRDVAYLFVCHDVFDRPSAYARHSIVQILHSQNHACPPAAFEKSCQQSVSQWCTRGSKLSVSVRGVVGNKQLVRSRVDPLACALDCDAFEDENERTNERIMQEANLRRQLEIEEDEFGVGLKETCCWKPENPRA